MIETVKCESFLLIKWLLLCCLNLADINVYAVTLNVLELVMRTINGLVLWDVSW